MLNVSLEQSHQAALLLFHQVFSRFIKTLLVAGMGGREAGRVAVHHPLSKGLLAYSVSMAAKWTLITLLPERS